MRVLSIGACQSTTCRGGGVLPQDEKIVKAAQNELEAISKEGKCAGTNTAWWRAGFTEAKEALEKLVSNVTGFSAAEDTSSLMRFHDTDEDGFI